MENTSDGLCWAVAWPIGVQASYSRRLVAKVVLVCCDLMMACCRGDDFLVAELMMACLGDDLW